VGNGVGAAVLFTLSEYTRDALVGVAPVGRS
jgi:hypothetical protein